MKVGSQKAGDCRIKLIVNADAEETRPDYDKTIAEYLQHGRIPGFRPGKAPLEVIGRRYQREIDEDVRQRLIARFYRQAVESEKLNVANIVDVADVLFSPATGISFVMTVDLVPTFKLPKYQKLPIKFNPVVVDEEKVARQIDSLRASLTRYEPTETPVASGDMVQIDYTATSGGKPLQEAVPDSGRLAGATDFWTRAMEPEFIPGIAAALVGLAGNDTRELTVKFPKDFVNEALRGVKAVYSIIVKAVRRAAPPRDDEMVKQLGFETLNAFQTRIRDNLQQEAEHEEERRRQQEVADYLLKKCEFPLPRSVVAAETQRTLRRMLGELGQHEGANEYVEKNRETILNNASASAANRVRLNYIFRAIAEAEKIAVTELEVSTQILAATQYYASRGEKDLTPAKLRERLEAGDGIEMIRQDLLNSKVVQWLINDAKT
jgi:trigger factor